MEKHGISLGTTVQACAAITKILGRRKMASLSIVPKRPLSPATSLWHHSCQASIFSTLWTKARMFFFLSSDNKLILCSTLFVFDFICVRLYLCSTLFQMCSTFSPGTTNGTEFSDLELVSEWKLRDDIMFFPPGVANGTAPEPLPPLPDHFPNDHYGSWQCGCSPGEAVSQCARARYCLDSPPALSLTDFPQKNSLPSELFSEFFKWALTHIPTVRL